MKRLVLIFTLMAFPAVAYESGKTIYARGVCQTHEGIAEIAALLQDGKTQESDALFVDHIGAGRCTYAPMGTPVVLIKQYEPYTWEGRNLHLWSVKTANGLGFLILEDG